MPREADELPIPQPLAHSEESRQTVALVSLSSLLANLKTLRGMCRKEIIPVIKANAYGHGLIAIAKALAIRGSCSTLGVATLDEALRIREAIPQGVDILVLSGFVPAQVHCYTRYRITPVVHSLRHLQAIAVERIPPIHLKIDTGMHRLGILPEEVDEALRILTTNKLKLSGLATQFADCDNVQSSFVDRQTALFEYVVRQCRERRLLLDDARIHLANSAAVLRRKVGCANAVRPGLALYGISPFDYETRPGRLLPVLEWKTRVLTTKVVAKGETVGYGRTYTAHAKTTIAVLPVGYAHGYPRCLSGKADVLIGSRRARLCGRVSMDLMAINVTAHSRIKDGAEVTLLGRRGKESVSAQELARVAGMTPYEILCGISDRVPRLYLD